MTSEADITLQTESYCNSYYGQRLNRKINDF